MRDEKQIDKKKFLHKKTLSLKKILAQKVCLKSNSQRKKKNLKTDKKRNSHRSLILIGAPA